MLLEDRGDDRSVWCPVPGGGSKLFVEPVPPTGRVHHDDLARLIGQVEERVGDLRWQVGKAALIELERALLADHGFGVDAYGVLITLVSAPGGTLTIGDLGERRNLSPSGVSRSVDRLAKIGLVERSANPADGRSLLVGLTPQGLTRLRAVQVTHHAVVRRLLLDRLSERDLKRLGELWEKAMPGSVSSPAWPQ